MPSMEPVEKPNRIRPICSVLACSPSRNAGVRDTQLDVTMPSNTNSAYKALRCTRSCLFSNISHL